MRLFFIPCRRVITNKQKILSSPATRWTLEEIKAIAEQMRKTDPDLIAARANKAANSNKKKSQ